MYKRQEKLHAGNHSLHGQAMHDHITIRINRAQRHYWSPQLNVLMYREPEDVTTRLVGVYGPMPNVWTLFTLSYLAIGVITLFIRDVYKRQLYEIFSFFIIFFYWTTEFPKHKAKTNYKMKDYHAYQNICNHIVSYILSPGIANIFRFKRFI